MITESMIFWILKLDDLRLLFMIGSLSSVLIFAITAVVWGIQSEEGKINASLTAKSICKKALISSVVCAFLTVILPSTKQMAMIKVIPVIVNSEIVHTMSNDAKQIYDLAINALKEKLTIEDKETEK